VLVRFRRCVISEIGNGAVATGDPTSRRSCPRAPSTPGRQSGGRCPCPTTGLSNLAPAVF